MQFEKTPTITEIKSLLKLYKKRRWAFIYRDSLGIHIKDNHYGKTYVGELKWARYKYET